MVADDHADPDRSPALPDAVVERATTLTRRARDAVDENEREAYRRDRDRLLDDHGYTARVRSEDTGDVLVLYPTDWLEDGVVRVDRVEDTGDAVEVPLTGPDDVGTYDDVEAHNRTVAERVAADHGEVDGATAHALADFMSNHYVKPIEAATPRELAEFRTEYFPRNAWPTDEQRSRLETSIDRIVETAERLEDEADDDPADPDATD